MSIVTVDAGATDFDLVYNAVKSLGRTGNVRSMEICAWAVLRLARSRTVPMNPILRQLGFSYTDRVVVVHADDIGMCPGTLPAMEELFAVGLVTSASVMVPCPCFAAVTDWLRSHPSADLGVHLTLTSEFSGYRWGPISTPSSNSGLTDQQGYFHRTAAAVRQLATPDAVRAEMEAQISLAEQLGLAPTHLDSHMYAALCAEFIDDYVQLAFERGIPAFVPRVLGTLLSERDAERRRIQQWESRGLPIFDHREVATRQSRIDDQEAFVRSVFERLPIGLSCILIHPVADSPEIRRIAPDWRSRVADFEAFRNPSLPDHIRHLGINLISYRRLCDAMRSRLSA